MRKISKEKLLHSLFLIFFIILLGFIAMILQTIFNETKEDKNENPPAIMTADTYIPPENTIKPENDGESNQENWEDGFVTGHAD